MSRIENPTRRSKRGETPQARLALVAKAAFECMSRRGFHRTQMADVAVEAGLSPAALYTYAKGKEGLLTLAFLHVFEDELPATPLPVTPLPMKKIIAMAHQRISEVAHWPTLDAAIAAERAPDLATLKKIGAEVYDLLDAFREGIWLIDELSLELPEFEKLQAEKVHGAFLRKLIALIGKWQAPGIVTDIAARNAVEMMAWPAMHRHRDQWLIPQASEAQIRETAICQYAALLKATQKA